MSRKNLDGGYYAVKGFIYQYDATILKIMQTSSENDFVEIENVQDFSTRDEVYQIKYKESQKYSDSKVRRALLQLLNEWKENKKRRYHLMVHFKDKDPKVVELTCAEIKKIIGNDTDSFEENELESFSKVFFLIFKEDYLNQIKLVLEALKEFAKNDEKALLWHGFSFRYLMDKVAVNKTKDKRVCSRKELIENLHGFEQKYFDRAYKDFLGNRKYLAYIKRIIFPSKLNTNSMKRLFVLELRGNETESSIIAVLQKIADRFVRKTSKSRLGDAPYVFLRNMDSNSLVSLKERLYCSENCFVDGYPFLGADFKKENLSQDFRNIKTGISLRFINSIDELKTIEDGFWDEIYDFSVTGSGGLFSNGVQVYIDTINDIKQIL